MRRTPFCMRRTPFCKYWQTRGFQFDDPPTVPRTGHAKNSKTQPRETADADNDGAHAVCTVMVVWTSLAGGPGRCSKSSCRVQAIDTRGEELLAHHPHTHHSSLKTRLRTPGRRGPPLSYARSLARTVTEPTGSGPQHWNLLRLAAAMVNIEEVTEEELEQEEEQRRLEEMQEHEGGATEPAAPRREEGGLAGRCVTAGRPHITRSLGCGTPTLLPLAARALAPAQAPVACAAPVVVRARREEEEEGSASRS